MPANRQHDRPTRGRVYDDAAFQAEHVAHHLFVQFVFGLSAGVQTSTRHSDEIVGIARRPPARASGAPINADGMRSEPLLPTRREAIGPDILPKARWKERVAELLVNDGLKPEMAGRYPRRFSGGQRQRIAIAPRLPWSRN